MLLGACGNVGPAATYSCGTYLIDAETAFSAYRGCVIVGLFG